jgi:hypothetical protein
MSHEATDDNVITNITAMPILKEVSTFLETPRKGHIPKNLVKTKLFTRIEPANKRNNSIIYPPSLSLYL